MAKFMRGLIFWPLLVVSVALALANRAPAQLSFDPFNAENPAFAVTLPLFVIVMGGVLLGIVLGGLSAWADQAQWRRRAQVYQRKAAQLEAQLNAAPAPAPASGGLPTVMPERRAG
jgi:uncharacterized integral membrane protein